MRARLACCTANRLFATCPKKKMQRQRAGYPMCPARATPHGARTSEASHQEGNKRPQPPTRSAAKGGATARKERAKRATERNEAPPAADTKCRERGGHSAPPNRPPHGDLIHHGGEAGGNSLIQIIFNERSEPSFFYD